MSAPQVERPHFFARRRPLSTLIAVAVLALGQAACGGGGGDSSPANPGGTTPTNPTNPGDDGTQTPALTAPQPTPVNAATAVARTTIPTLAFNTNVAPASVTASTITLSLGATAVSAPPTVSGATVTLTPGMKLAPLATYTLGASTGVTNTAGVALPAAFSSTFTTADGAWDATAATLGTGTAPTPTTEPPPTASAVNAQGNAVAIWVHDNTVQGSTMDPATGTWTAAQTLYTVEANPDVAVAPLAPSFPAVAIAADGSAVAVWTGSTPVLGANEPRLFAATFANGTWSTGARIDTPTDYVTNVARKSIVSTGSGEATVVFNAMDPRPGNPYGVYAASLAGGTWTFTKLDNGNGGYTGYGDTTPQVVAGPSGALTAGWLQVGTTLVDVAVASRAAGGAWSTPAVITSGADSDQLSLAADGSGRAALAWRSAQAPSALVYTSHIDAAGAAPSAAEAVDTGEASRPSISLHPNNGDLLVTWVGTHAAGPDAMARRRLAAGTWETPLMVSNGTGVVETRVAYDPVGNALATYNQNNGTAYTLVAARWIAASGWQSPTVLGGDAANPVAGGTAPLRFDASGSALQVWQAGSTIHASRFQ